MGFDTQYSYYVEDGPHDLEQYNASIYLYSPFKLVPELYSNATVEIEENVCKIDFMFDTEKTKIDISGVGEVKSLRYFVSGLLIYREYYFNRLTKDVSIRR